MAINYLISIFALNKKNKNMKTVNCGGDRSENSLTLQYCIKGKMIRYLVPAFDGVEVRVKNCYTDSAWAEHGSDKNNSGWQMSEACRLIHQLALKDPKVREKFSDEDLERLKNGLAPLGYTVHHAYNIGKDLIAVLVKTDEHKSIPHKGASYFANEKNLMRDTQEDDNINAAKKIFNKISHEMHKNPEVTSIIIGSGVSAITYYIMKDKANKPTRTLLSGLLGLASAVGVYYFLTKDKVIYC